jgi:hypothetical protein
MNSTVPYLNSNEKQFASFGGISFVPTNSFVVILFLLQDVKFITYLNEISRT